MEMSTMMSKFNKFYNLIQLQNLGTIKSQYITSLNSDQLHVH